MTRRYRRRTFAEVTAQARTAERAQVAEFGRWQIAAVTNLIAAGTVDAESGSLLRARLAAFVEQVEQGLHLTGSEPASGEKQ
ncbi:hypothetical protein NUH86_10860 [Sphingobium sp. JS3065]|uniref:hypothetical protein n=1 Tax=Sphingobium sp. JS3065 TaxID=2970925 RepID=UPI002263C562|nr:hypothetical protein [Sphingobium sp. JS3065]UZW54035.1 hypothetical protein NUH86_10860 [Sphingobium sp. JS3065]